MNNLYEVDLAYVHHNGFGGFADQSGDQILRILADHHIDSGLIVDLGCGSGIWAAKLVAAGFDVLGVDISASMLSLARQNVSTGDFVQSSVFDFQPPTCASMTALGEVLGYGSPALPNSATLERLFNSVVLQLPVGGLFIFDLIVKSPGELMNYKSWNSGIDWAVLVKTEEQPDGNSLTRKITVFRQLDGAYRRSEECHLVRVFDRTEIQRLLNRAGFDVTLSELYGEYKLAPRRIAFIAEKRAVTLP